ncbi:uncharacterized protein LOC117530302 isoform X1 [Thalassophryne amazonica]|uniref:uncharacterized protein LOC117530302 isoform X1 n=1 Tax=Thalassophryne amazonica TaxID=390379 RepID=UPI001470E024|nr:uncharacterized protein LOC117530302 isoform X1 [Thalassophryne amazonica]
MCQQGVNGPSVVMQLPHYDSVKGICSESQHTAFLGVTRHFVGTWLDSANRAEAYYIGDQVKKLDERLQDIAPPSEITRCPRSLKTRKYWKASEWRALLFYSLVVFQGILPAVYMKHWFLFVFGIYYLMSESVSERKVRESNACLRMFVLMTERLYGIRHCTFNVHSLIHFAQSVINIGPLWATSTFVFEGYNRTLIRCFHSTQKVGFQICETFSLMKVMTELAVSCMEENTDVSVLYTSLASRHTKSKCTNVLSNNLHALGKGEQVILPPSKLLAASRLTGNQVHTSAIVYEIYFSPPAVCQQ